MRNRFFWYEIILELNHMEDVMVLRHPHTSLSKMNSTVDKMKAGSTGKSIRGINIQDVPYISTTV